MTRVHRKPNKKGKIKSHEKSKQRIHGHAVALAFAFAPGGEAAPRLDGGPSPSATSKIVSANSDAGAKLGKPDDILPVVSISFAPVGLTLNQTARLNLVNMNVANGITLAGGSSTRRVPYSLNPQLPWESAKSFLSISSGTRIRCQTSYPYSSELRCNFNWTFSPMESRVTASAGVWRYSIITPAKRRCTWVVKARKQSEA
jgi:hypothetical protein